MIYHKIQITIKQDSYTKANESGEEAQKETMRLIDIGLPQSKNKVNSNSKARIACSWPSRAREIFSYRSINANEVHSGSVEDYNIQSCEDCNLANCCEGSFRIQSPLIASPWWEVLVITHWRVHLTSLSTVKLSCFAWPHEMKAILQSPMQVQPKRFLVFDSSV